MAKGKGLGFSLKSDSEIADNIIKKTTDHYHLVTDTILQNQIEIMEALKYINSPRCGELTERIIKTTVLRGKFK